MSTDDSPEREFDIYDSEGFPRAPLDNTEGTSNVSEIKDSDISNPLKPTEKPKSSRIPRREVWWLDLGAKDQSLETIIRRFEDCLDRFLLSSSNSLLRHITSPMDTRLRHNLHQCPGYLREEITLVSDVSKSVIISHAFPNQREICTVCGQLVQYKFTEPTIVDVEIQEAPYDQTQIREHTANGKPLAQLRQSSGDKHLKSPLLPIESRSGSPSSSRRTDNGGLLREVGSSANGFDDGTYLDPAFYPSLDGDGHHQSQAALEQSPQKPSPFQSPTMAHSPRNNAGTPGQLGPSNQPQQGQQQQDQPPMGQFGGSSMVYAHMNGSMNPMGSAQQQQQLPQQLQQHGGPPTPAGMMHFSPSLTSPQPPGGGMGPGSVLENNINARIPTNIILQLKRETGVADKDLATLTILEKVRSLFRFSYSLNFLFC